MTMKNRSDMHANFLVDKHIPIAFYCYWKKVKLTKIAHRRKLLNIDEPDLFPVPLMIFLLKLHRILLRPNPKYSQKMMVYRIISFHRSGHQNCNIMRCRVVVI